MGLSQSQATRNGPEVQFVDTEIKNNCVVIFSKTTCPYCHATKQLFNNLGVSTKVYELDQRGDGAAIQSYLGDITGARTVPRVFIGGRCAGGNSEVQSLHKSGKLTEWLQQCENT